MWGEVMLEKNELIEALFSKKCNISINGLNGYLTLTAGSVVFKSFNFKYKFIGKNNYLKEAFIRGKYNYCQCISDESIYYAHEKFNSETKGIYKTKRFLNFEFKIYNNKDKKREYYDAYYRYGIDEKYIDKSEQEKDFIIYIEELAQKIPYILMEEIECKAYEEAKEKLRVDRIKSEYQEMIRNLDTNVLANYKVIVDYEKKYKKELRIISSKIKVNKFIEIESSNETLKSFIRVNNL